MTCPPAFFILALFFPPWCTFRPLAYAGVAGRRGGRCGGKLPVAGTMQPDGGGSNGET